MSTTLQGQRILLRPLQYSDAAALLHAAADGELWNLTVTVVPSASTVDSYLKKPSMAVTLARSCRLSLS